MNLLKPSMRGITLSNHAVGIADYDLLSAIPAGFTVSRASSAQYFDAARVLKTAGSDIPVFDHAPDTGAALGLRLETAATQLLLNQSAFEQSSWIKFKTTVLANDATVVDPAGGQNADLILEDTTATSLHHCRQAVTISPAQFFRLVVFLKPNAAAVAAGRYLHANICRANGATLCAAYINFAAMTVTTGAESGGLTAGLSATLTALPNGWYMLNMVGKPTGAADTTMNIRFELATGTTLASRTYNGDGASGFWIYQPNLYASTLEQSPFPAVTRATDVLSIAIQNGIYDIEFTTPSGIYYERDVVVSNGTWQFAFPIEAQNILERFVSRLRIVAAPGFDALVDADNASLIPFETYGLIAVAPAISSTEILDPAVGSGATSMNTAWNTSKTGVKSAVDLAKAGIQAHGVATTVYLNGADRIIQGHKNYIGGLGGGFWVGNTGGVSQLQRSIIRDFTFAPGIDPIANPSINANQYPSSDAPFAGQSAPAGGFGRAWNDRDGLTVANAIDLVIENCAFIYSIDEAIALYRLKTELATGSVIRNVLIRRCLIGPSLRFPKGPTASHGNVLVHPDAIGGDIHNKGSLVGYMDHVDRTTLSNIRFEKCVFACNRERNPQLGSVAGATVDSNLIYGWGTTGIAYLNPDNPGTLSGGSLMARGNLFQPINGYSTIGAEIALYADPGGTRFLTKDNYRLGATRVDDVKLPFGTVALINGATRKSMTRTPPFSTPYGYDAVSSEAQRQALYDDILNYVGPRERDGNGVLLSGDAHANPTVAAILGGIRNGTLLPIDYPGPTAPTYDAAVTALGPGYLY